MLGIYYNMVTIFFTYSSQKINMHYKAEVLYKRSQNCFGFLAINEYVLKLIKSSMSGVAQFSHSQ